MIKKYFCAGFHAAAGKKTNIVRENERGIALLMTLGVLAMLIVLALAFATTSQVNLKEAVNNNDLTVARLLAESAVQRVVGIMRFYSTQSMYYDNVFSHDESDSVIANRKNYDGLYRIGTATDDVSYTWPSVYDPESSEAVHWQYIYNGLTGGNRKIIGRIAFVTASNTGKLDPSACVDSGGSPVNENTTVEERNGVHIKEINIKNLDPANSTTYLPAADVSNLSSTNASPAGMLTDGARWPDWGILFSLLDIANNPQKEQYRLWFVIDNPPDPEAFWVDTDGDGQIDSGESYHRFNLARTDWNSLAVANIVANPTVYSASPSTHDGTGIKWLNNWSDAGTFSSTTARKNQIAANLIDYCDSNDDVTTDSASDPTYTGNEKTPYINELAMEVQCTVVMINIPGPEKEAHLNFYIRCGGELINMYGENFSAATTLRMIGKIDFDYRAEDPPDVHHYNGDYDRTFTLTPIGSSAYMFTWDAQPFLVEKVFVVMPPHKVWAENVRVSINKAILTYNSKFTDCAKPDAAGEYSESLAELVQRDNNGTNTTSYNYEIDDPRQNLNPSDWDAGNCPALKDQAYEGTANAINTSKVTCTASGDAEAGSTPTTISTRYIRNGPMQSPWELGFIHRGAKWETLNIDKYNETDGLSGVSNAIGGGAYASGDANILDQIKMTNSVEAYGKVNINASNQNVVKALLAYTRTGVPLPNNGSDGIGGNADDNAPGSKNNGTVLDYNTDVTNMASAITGSSDRLFKTRGQIVKVAKLSDGSEITQNTDILKEEIIGKMINLAKASSSDTINIIALAQSIRDVGGNVTIKKDLDNNGSIGMASEVALGSDINGDNDAADTNISETISNCTYGTYDQYADEILAEQKILVSVYKNPVTGKWKIIKYMYIEE